MENQSKDVFICHASEDKGNVVHSLVEAFKKAEISYWVDEAEIGWGDIIMQKIYRGLASSRYVIVILSVHFLKKAWAQQEFYAALNDEISSGEVKVLPLIVGSESEKNEITYKFPMVKDKLYLSWDDGVENIVYRLQQRLRLSDKPEIYNEEESPNAERRDIVNGIEMVLASQENGSLCKCEEWIWTKDDSIMIKIPSGKFWRGSQLGDGANNEMPQIEVYLDEFFIDKYPVTNEQFAKFIEEYKNKQGTDYLTTAEKNGYAWKCDRKKWYKEQETWRDYYSIDRLKHPVVCVSVEDATEYCIWASKQLPTEAQWEKAARGEKGFIYPWGTKQPTPNKHARYLTPSGDLTGTVNVSDEEYQAGQSPFGCFHMAGNIWEWCKDYYDNYPKATSLVRNPEGPSKGQVNLETGQPLYVNRGGSWADNWCALRCAARSGDPSDAYFHVGFRCVLNIKIE